MKLPDTLAIKPVTAPLRAAICVPGSKSITNRALLLAAMAHGKSTLRGALGAEDTDVMVDSLKRLGFGVCLKSDDEKHSTRNIQRSTVTESNCAIEVEGRGGAIPAPNAELFIGNAGTAARFLTAFVATANGEYQIDGTPRMRERPMATLFNALRELGADIRFEKQSGHFPVTIRARGLRGNFVKVESSESSQFASALLMIAPLIEPRGSGVPPRQLAQQIAAGRRSHEVSFALELRDTPVSEPYLRMTHLLMQKFGVVAKPLDSRRGWSVRRGQNYSARDFVIPPDASAASYFFAAAALCGGSVTVRGLNRKFADNLQGDAEFVEYLQRLGCRVSENDGVRVTGALKRGASFARPLNMADISDVAITLAVVAPFLSRPTTIHGLAHARLQETDRVSAVATELRKVGSRVEMLDDGWTIFPTTQFRPATIETHNDHRLAMAFSILGLKDVMQNGRPWLRIKNPACVAKTFPNFFETLELLRAL